MFGIFFLFLTSFSFGEIDCTLFEGRACLYIPKENSIESLHLYIRGHHNGRKDFPPQERTLVAKETLLSPILKLRETAEKSKMIVVASGSSAVSFNESDLKSLEDKYQLRLQHLTMSAHSGGYWGLNLTLRDLSSKFSMIKKILMLDNFYSTDETGLIQILGQYVQRGIPCLGYMTDHNLERVKKYYSFCQVEGPKGFSHSESVGPYLEANLK